MKKRAFTLIELLVVISIIAVLMSIMMPALGRARQQAKGVVCLANLKQIGQVVELYLSDFNDTLPNSDQNSFWYNWSFKMVQAGLVDVEKDSKMYGKGFAIEDKNKVKIGEFVGMPFAKKGDHDNIFQCPSVTDKDMYGVAYPDTSRKIQMEDYLNAYGTPWGVMGSIDNIGPDFTRRGKLRNPASIIAAFDGNNFPQFGASRRVGPIWATMHWVRDDYEYMRDEFISTRHSNKDGYYFNSSFLDGHAKRMTIKDLKLGMFPNRMDPYRKF